MRPSPGDAAQILKPAARRGEGRGRRARTRGRGPKGGVREHNRPAPQTPSHGGKAPASCRREHGLVGGGRPRRATTRGGCPGRSRFRRRCLKNPGGTGPWGLARGPCRGAGGRIHGEKPVGRAPQCRSRFSPRVPGPAPRPPAPSGARCLSRPPPLGLSCGAPLVPRDQRVRGGEPPPLPPARYRVGPTRAGTATRRPGFLPARAAEQHGAGGGQPAIPSTRKLGHPAPHRPPFTPPRFFLPPAGQRGPTVFVAGWGARGPPQKSRGKRRPPPTGPGCRGWQPASATPL